MRLGEDVADEVLGEIGIVRQPVVAIVLVPAFEPLALGREMLAASGRDSCGPMVADGADQDRGLHALGMVRGQHAGDACRRATGRPGSALPASRGIHDGERVRHVVVERVGGHLGGPVGLAVAPAVEGDAAEALAEVGQLRLVDARVDDAPGRQEHHRLRAVAVDLVVELHAVAFDEPFLGRQLCAHDITSSMQPLPQCE